MCGKTTTYHQIKTYLCSIISRNPIKRDRDMRYSVIIPVYNRPDEVDELLQSLTRQSFKDFEVIIVEDGSSVPCKNVADRYQDILNIRYYSKPNSGPGQTRNYGAKRSRGEYLIILDSDCILPEDYFQEVEKELQETPADAFGGPDRAHASFTDVQKAINYSMTSFFTTGGIRGGKKKMDKFYPRSFNMGVRREVYEALGGFSRMRFGEDIDFSIRIFKGGYRCRLFPGAWVYHKRRTDLKKFFKQVHNSGIARINLYKKHPDSLKIVHLLPAAFTLGVVVLLAGAPFCLYSLLPVALYALLVCTDSAIQNKSLRIGLYSIAASFIQLIGYGTGFWRAWWNRCILGKDEFEAFKKNFYK
jgi:GT2 family glycosyltransferase